MEKEENLTEETQATDESTPSEAGNEAVPTQDAPESLTLKELNEITGKTFKSKDAALKSIKDMNSQAGKVSDLQGRLEKYEEDGKKPDESQAQYEQRIAELEAETFYARNSDHEANRDLIEALAKANGVSRKEVLEMDTYKNVFEKMQTADEASKKRTVASSNNRIAQGTQDETFDPKGKSADELAEFVTENYITNK